MELVNTLKDQNDYPSSSELEKMTNNELFEIANRNASFKKVMVKYILSLNVKPKPVVVIYYEEGKYDIRKLGLSERLKNSLLLGGFAFLTELTEKSKSDMLMLRGLGKNSLEELIMVMDCYGFELVEK